MKQFDVVKLLRDLPDYGLLAGAVGAVLDVYHTPRIAYEVEFCDENGRPIAQLALEPGDVMLVQIP